MRLHGTRHGETVLETRGITKIFPGVVANDGIDLGLHHRRFLTIRSTRAAVLSEMARLKLEPDAHHRSVAFITLKAVVLQMGNAVVYGHFKYIIIFV